MGAEFWQTPMGQRYYQHTLPELVKQLGRLADLGERSLPLLEAVVRPAQSRANTADGAASAASGGERSSG